MGKDKLFLKKANTKTNPMEIYRKKMRDKEKTKMKEKRKNNNPNHNNNNNDNNRKPKPSDPISNPLFENLYSNKKNNQIASINPDMISEDIDSFQNLFEQKPAPTPETNFNQNNNKKNDNHQDFGRRNEQYKPKNNKEKQNNRPSTETMQKDPRFSDPFFQVTYQENYNPLKKPQRPNQPPNPTINPNLPLPEGPQSDIFFQRNPPGEDQVERLFAPVIQKEAELKNKSKIDVTKEKILFVPASVRMKQLNPNSKPEPKEMNYGSIRNISNVPAPSFLLSNNENNNLNNNSSFQKLSSFLDEINKLNN